jgi:hypothetical protein
VIWHRHQDWYASKKNRNCSIQLFLLTLLKDILGLCVNRRRKKPGSLSEFLLSLLRWLLSDRVEDELGPTPAAMFEEGPFALFCISSGARFMRRG